jgi:serine phosphatase RsbU (regulator of sigma subunit)
VTSSGIACQIHLASRQLPLVQGVAGDVFEALETPFGTRLLIGDVMGSGAPANETGRAVVSAWRELAVTEPTLAGIAVRLHTLIARSAHPERFVTALLATFGCCCEGVQLVCCGHPPPLLLRDGSASFVETFPAPPLGLMDLADGWCSAVSTSFLAGDRLLFYTDGVSEARDADGEYFPLSDRARQGAELKKDVLDYLLDRLREHIGHSQADDILLVLASK